MNKLLSLIPLALMAATGCSRPPEYQAKVELQLDGVAHGYETARAQIDQQIKGGRYSLYLLPADEDQPAPYLCLRTYAGNPVAHLWLRAPKPGADVGDDFGKYECFVPGTLSNGTQTLGWKTKDGKKRDNTETGEPNCEARVVQEGDQLILTFDAQLRREGSKAKKKPAEGQGEAPLVAEVDTSGDVIHAVGRAVLQLGG